MAEIAESNITEQKTPVCLQRFSSRGQYIAKYGVPPTNVYSIPKKPEPGFDSLVVDRDYLWYANADGSPIVLTVKFVDLPSHGSDAIISKVKQAAVQWEDHANIKFKWVGPDEEAVIRCGFKPGGGHWSYVGRDSTNFDEPENTMNLEFNDSSRDESIRATTLHEFGHALGCVHEQTNPNIVGTFTWNKKVIYQYYMGPPNNWTKEDVNDSFNSFKPFTGNISATEWDGNSIMQYQIKPGWTNPSMTVGRNRDLTAYDKWMIGQVYPRKT